MLSDDLLVFAPTEEEALNRLEMGFSQLRQHSLKLAPRKCYFLHRSVKFLGHIVSQSGVSTDPEKAAAIANMSGLSYVRRRANSQPPENPLILRYGHLLSKFYRGLFSYGQAFVQVDSWDQKKRKTEQEKKYNASKKAYSSRLDIWVQQII